jgi:hypothetical protein
MNTSLPPLSRSAVANSEEPDACENGAVSNLQSRARQSVETHPAFRGNNQACAIDIVSAGDKLIIHGRVPSWYHKQLLQEILRRVDGAGRVENNVLVMDALKSLSAN